MGGDAMFQVWNSTTVSGIDKLVLVAIAQRFNGHDECRLSALRLAKDTGLAQRTVQRSVERLEVAQALEVDHRKGRSSVFRLPGYVRATELKSSTYVRESDTYVRESSQPTSESPTEPRKLNQGKNQGFRASAKTPAPKTMELTPEMRTWAHNLAEEHQVTPPRSLAAETEAFLEYHQAKGTTFKDWGAAWHTWMRKAVEFTERDSHAVR